MNKETATATPTTAAVEKFNELIRDIRFAMLTTAAGDGSLRGRPMATLSKHLEGDLWFFTADDSAKSDEIIEDNHVCVTYADPERQKYVSVSGVARLVRDKARAEELWNPAVKAWFPAGIDDPHLALLRVRMVTVEYWDSPSSKMVQLFGFAKAVLTGKRIENAGDHKVIDVVPRKETM